MSNIQELEAKYIELGKEIEKLKAEQPKEFPQIGDEYWYIYHSGVTMLPYANDHADKGFQAIGNFFQFKEQALAELETRKVIAELKKCKGVKKFVDGDINWCLLVEDVSVVVDYWHSNYKGLFNIYFDSEESTQEAINKVGKQRIVNVVKWQAEGDYSWV